MTKKKKLYIVLLAGLIILFFYWQKREADKAQSIKESQFQSAIGSAADDFSYYLETNDINSYWYGISNLKVASWILHLFPEDSVPYMTMRDFVTLHGYMLVSPEVANKYLPEIIDLFLRMQENINDNAAFMMMLDYSNRISYEISENSN